ncbi:GreA/GreB family elongation factor [Paenibacillus motobuensis]|uniref:Transcription elongation factor GreA/GreB C-terminal domain-containing protein n=1 Tax=Paenibacillus motobuensis TaxID=295324 RepID=A0ABN0YHE2_9BACL
MLKNAKVVDSDSVEEGTVGSGSTGILTIWNLKRRYNTNRGPTESDAFENKISYESPLGKEILGKKIGTIINIASSSRYHQYEILEIK